MSVTSTSKLRTIDLFDGLPDERLAAWAAVTVIQDYAAGEVLLEQGSSPGLLLLFSGTVRARLAVDGAVDAGTPNTGPTWIGAISAITESPLPATVEADGPCHTGMIPREAFFELVLQDRSVFRKVMHVIEPVMRGLSHREASRERLTSLGTMAAGLAHELNNPAAAARRAASELVDAVGVINHAQETFVDAGIERADADRLLRLQQEALGMCIIGGRLTGVAASDAEDALLDALDARGVPDGWKFAEPLATVGLDADWLDRVQAIAGPATGATLAWVAASLTAHELAAELVDSTERISRLVSAIKSYAYLDRGEVVQADVHEGLDSTLTMLGHKLKQTRITVTRDYDTSLPPLTMYGSELNQAWTNLLDNAVWVLGESGAITITTRPDSGGVRVDIADDGPGIAPAIREHVFDPFFTTRPPGSGTGMGLDVARRIVEQRHRGSLTFETGERGTTFHVRLPLNGVQR